MAVIFQDIFFGLIDDYHSGEFGTYHEPQSTAHHEGYLERTLATCILSSNWVYEKAKHAAEGLVAEHSLHVSQADVPDAESLEAYLRIHAKCRYPRMRASQLSGSFRVWKEVGCSLSSFQSAAQSDNELRSIIVDSFPGLGLKQASMFLRDAEVTMNLAIIDVHILWYMKYIEGWAVDSLSKKEYSRIEDHLRTTADRLQMPLGVLDSLIWTSVRALKKARREREWEVQYALPLEASIPLSALPS